MVNLNLSLATEYNRLGGCRSAHHVGFGGEFLGLQTLDGHPLDRQLGLPVVLNTVVLLVKHITRHAEVCHLHCVRLVQPDHEVSFIGDPMTHFHISKGRTNQINLYYFVLHNFSVASIKIHKL